MGSWPMARADDGVGGIFCSPIARLGTYQNPFSSALPFAGLVNSGPDTSMRGKKTLFESLFWGEEAVNETLLGPGYPSQPRYPLPSFASRAQPSPRSGTVPFCRLLPPPAAARPLQHVCQTFNSCLYKQNNQTVTCEPSHSDFSICKIP